MESINPVNLNTKNNNNEKSSLLIPGSASCGAAFGIAKTFIKSGKYKKIANLSKDEFKKTGKKIPKNLRKYSFEEIKAISKYKSKEILKQLPKNILVFSALFSTLALGGKILFDNRLNIMSIIKTRFNFSNKKLDNQILNQQKAEEEPTGDNSNIKIGEKTQA